MTKKAPFTKVEIEALSARHHTPFYIYDEMGIRAAARQLINAFSWNEGFKEYFAVKATPNPHILRILKEEGCGTDCSSLPELLLSERVGVTGENVMFTSNDTPIEEFARAKKMGVWINLDALDHLEYIEKHIGLPGFISFRYNPGPTRDGNAIIGKPEESKFGMTLEQLFEGYRRAREMGIGRFGLHAMIASNERNASYFVETARMLFTLVQQIRVRSGVEIERINIGGGLGIPYHPNDPPVDLGVIGAGIRELYEECTMSPARLAMECGRYITGPHGYLIARVRHLKETYRTYAGLDATMANLMRPGMYGAYHHITVLGKEDLLADKAYDVVGSLCENNDKFAIQRILPRLDVDDIVVIHDAGAHGHAMGFNYNGKLRSAEFLMTRDRDFKMIRRAETIGDLFATLIS